MRLLLRHACVAVALAILVQLASSAAEPADRARLRAVTAERYGQPGLDTLRDWFRLLDLASAQPVAVQLDRVNQFFNIRTRFETDQEAWGQPDYWATPLETLMHGSGDCEDFAIAKYFTLLALGIPRDRLRLIYVRALIGGQPQAHMVLGYYPQPTAVPLILDNLDGRIEPATARPDLAPVFSFNGDGLWAGNVRAPGDPTVRLSRWRDLLQRAHDEGFE